MNANYLTTTDVFRIAFFICHGCRISKIKVEEHNKNLVSFLAEGKDILQLDKDYRSGQAKVNPLEFRETLTYVKDMMFKHLRQRGNNDRRRNYKGNQKY